MNRSDILALRDMKDAPRVSLEADQVESLCDLALECYGMHESLLKVQKELDDQRVAVSLLANILELKHTRAEKAERALRNMMARLDRDGGQQQEGESLDDTVARIDSAVSSLIGRVLDAEAAAEKATDDQIAWQEKYFEAQTECAMWRETAKARTAEKIAAWQELHVAVTNASEAMSELAELRKQLGEVNK